MLDHRMETFLLVCDLMNYHKAADTLGLTQPAVTQQIRFLEQHYNCKLFDYKSHKLIKTEAAIVLEQYARAMRLTESHLKEQLISEEIIELRIGATKTIGDYFLPPYIHHFLEKKENALNLIVDNTSVLLHMLQNNQLDFAIVEGFFNKTNYDNILVRKEPFVGICKKDHPFAGKEISISEIFEETIIHREDGSGTRAILEKELSGYNESLQRFKRRICISSFPLILDMVKHGYGISFVYNVLADSDSDIAKFTFKEHQIVREFNIVFLKHANAKAYIRYFFDQEDFL